MEYDIEDGAEIVAADAEYQAELATELWLEDMAAAYSDAIAIKDYVLVQGILNDLEKRGFSAEAKSLKENKKYL
ncbi:MAG TPA: hypothetical protein VIY48_16315 [Candidatus Paceibacterota bacterium]